MPSKSSSRASAAVLTGPRVPPHSYEAEESVLGSLLIDKNAIIKIADLVDADDFYKTTHRLIYRSCRDLYDKSEPIDVLSVANRLREKKELDAVGGDAAVAYLATVVPTAGNVLHYGRIVHKYATLRRLITAAADITELGFSEAADLSETLDQAEKALYDVSRDFRHHTFIKIGDALEEAFERIDRLHKGEASLRGVPTGFPALDHKLAGWQNADLIILAARPSFGKTTLALDFARYAALSGIPVGVFSLEMSKEQIVDRLLAAHAHVDLWRLRTGRLKMEGEFDDFARLGQAIGELSEIPIYIDDSASNNIMGIRTMARRLQAEHGLGLVVVDYLQLMESSRYTDNRVQEVSDISRSLKKLAIELNVPVLALSQLSRAVELRTDQRPKLSDLRESGSIEQDADIVLFIHQSKRSEEDEPVAVTEIRDISLLIEKHRNGPTGEIPLRFHTQYVTCFTPEDHYDDSMVPAESPNQQVAAVG